MSKNTKEKIETNMAKNNILDRAFQGVAAFVLVFFAFRGVEHYVRLAYPFNALAAASFIVFVLYVLLSPMWRK